MTKNVLEDSIWVQANLCHFSASMGSYINSFRDLTFKKMVILEVHMMEAVNLAL